MDYPFRIIESKIGKRNQFDVTDGTQPTNALLFIKEGSFTMEIDGDKQEISSGDCVIFPDYLHFKRSVKSKITFLYIKFTSEKLSDFGALPYGKIDFRDKERFINTISLFEKYLEIDSRLSSNYRNHLLCDIILQIIAENAPQSSESDISVVSDSLLTVASRYIENSIAEKISIDSLCRNLGTNASTLNYRFRKVTGLSTWQYINEMRMKKARKLLATTTYSIGEISQRCGFDEVYYFSNSFKKHHGMSPMQYRNGLH